MRTERVHARWMAWGVGLVTLAVATTACGASGSTAPVATSGAGTSKALTAGPDPDVVALVPSSVRDTGRLVVGLEAQYPPFEFREPGSPIVVGADADLAARIGELMGLTVTYSDEAFDSLLPSLNSGKYDVVMSALSVTAERQRSTDFVTYFHEGDGALVKAGNPLDLGVNARLCGVKVAVLKGSTQQQNSIPLLNQACSGARRPPIRVTVVAASGELAPALQSGQVQAVLTDRSNAAYTAANSSGALDFAPGRPFNPAPLGVATPKGNGMAQAVQKALEVMIADGSYLQILTKWGVKDGAVDAAPVNEVSD